MGSTWTSVYSLSSLWRSTLYCDETPAAEGKGKSNPTCRHVKLIILSFTSYRWHGTIKHFQCKNSTLAKCRNAVGCNSSTFLNASSIYLILILSWYYLRNCGCFFPFKQNIEDLNFAIWWGQKEPWNNSVCPAAADRLGRAGPLCSALSLHCRAGSMILVTSPSLC